MVLLRSLKVINLNCERTCHIFLVSLARAKIWLAVTGLLFIFISLFTSSISLTASYTDDKTLFVKHMQHPLVLPPLVFFTSDPGSSVPVEIRARGPRAEHAFQMAMQTGNLKVYRGRIMLIGQDRAGKTSLKKSLLGLPFDPEQESTVGVEVNEVKNWMLSIKSGVSGFQDEIARFIVRETNKHAADDNDSTNPNVEGVKE